MSELISIEEEIQRLQNIRTELLIADLEDEAFEFLKEELQRMTTLGYRNQDFYKYQMELLSRYTRSDFEDLTWGAVLSDIYTHLFADILWYGSDEDDYSVKWPDTNHVSEDLFDKYLKTNPTKTPQQIVERMYEAKKQGLDKLITIFPDMDLK